MTADMILYSDDIAGDTSNGNQRVRFSRKAGVIVIAQRDAIDAPPQHAISVVTLAPKQVRALLAFARATARSRTPEQKAARRKREKAAK